MNENDSNFNAEDLTPENRAARIAKLKDSLSLDFTINIKRIGREKYAVHYVGIGPTDAKKHDETIERDSLVEAAVKAVKLVAHLHSLGKAHMVGDLMLKHLEDGTPVDDIIDAIPPENRGVVAEIAEECSKLAEARAKS